MPVAEAKLPTDYRRLGFQRCVTEQPVRGWEQPTEKRKVPSQWFVRSIRPRLGGWFGSTRRNLESVIQFRIGEAIESSRWILDLDHDWDEQGSSAYSQVTWQRACRFLILQAKRAHQVSGRELPPPKIQPGPEASIDLHWKMERFELLVNIPSDPSKPATFYGDDYGDLCIRGNLNPSEPIPGLIVWLVS
jgi:hypothetical protein